MFGINGVHIFLTPKGIIGAALFAFFVLILFVCAIIYVVEAIKYRIRERRKHRGNRGDNKHGD